MYRASVRPSNYFLSTPFSDTGYPTYTFCNSYVPNPTSWSPSVNPKIHGTGSHILFADGHVKLFDVSYYPEIPQQCTTTGDPRKGQWFNYVTGDKAFTIAITPSGS